MSITQHVNYSNSANGWDVTIYWECDDYDADYAYVWWEVNSNSYGRTFELVERANTSSRHGSGVTLSTGIELFLYVYKSGSYSQQAGPFTLSAPVRPTYTISYNANGGSGAPSSQTKTHGYTLTLSSTKPTRTGYTFLGWSTSKSATSATYDPGDSFYTDATTTLYAVWKIITYTVKFDANGGTGAPGNQTKTYGTALTLTSTKPTRTGYTFKSWNTKADGSGTSYASGGSYTSNAAVTLYAIWTANQYAVKYNANGGSGSMNDQTMTYDTAANLTANAFTYAGRTFTGWATSATGEKVYSDKQSVKNLVSTSGGSITLYAVWSINAITITFDAASNGGTCSEVSREIDYGSSLGTLPVASRPYYVFAGWYTAKTGGTKVTTTKTFTASTTLYAQFVIDASTSIKVSGAWKKGIPYVKVGGEYKKGYAWVKIGGVWKQGIG